MRTARKKAQLTAEALGGEVGVGRKTISDYECGKTKVPVTVLDLIASECDADIEELITGQPAKNCPCAQPLVVEDFASYENSAPYIAQVVQMMASMDVDMQKDICLSVEKEKLLRDLLRQQEDKKAG